MTDPSLDNCPRCHCEQSFRFSTRRSLFERLILPCMRRATVSCGRCGYRLHVRLTPGAKEILESRALKSDRGPIAVTSPIEEGTVKSSSEFTLLIAEMRERERALTPSSDYGPDSGDKEGLAS